MSWGRELRALRLAHGLAQVELGRLIGAHLGLTASAGQHLVSRLERGVGVRSVERAGLIAGALSEVFGCPVPLPPIDLQAGVRRGERRGGDVQHAVAGRVCPHCHGSGYL